MILRVIPKPATPLYREDLAWIHHTGFSEFSESAAPGIVRMLADHGLAGGLVVDIGCGSGALARLLTVAGFGVIGIDASSAMIGIARTTAPDARFHVAEFDQVTLPDCDAITAVGEVLNYTTLDQVKRFLRHAEAALRPGGLLLFDIAEIDAYPDYDERRIGGMDWSVIAIKERHGNRLSRRILTFREIDGQIRRDEEIHHLELYPRAEIVSAARQAGFRVRVRRSYGTRRLPPGHAVYFCQKRNAGGERRSGSGLAT